MHTVRLQPLDYFAYRPDDPKLAGRTYVGESPELALRAARKDATLFYKGQANVELIVEE